MVELFLAEQVFIFGAGFASSNGLGLATLQYLRHCSGHLRHSCLAQEIRRNPDGVSSHEMSALNEPEPCGLCLGQPLQFFERLIHHAACCCASTMLSVKARSALNRWLRARAS